METDTTPGDIIKLQSELERTKRTAERANIRLHNTRQELDEVNKKCDELGADKEKDVRWLEIELKGKEMFMEELTAENLKLKMEFEHLKNVMRGNYCTKSNDRNYKIH